LHQFNIPRLLIVDLEATCWERTEHKPSEMEIIEIGAMLIDSKSLQLLGEFQSFVKPLAHPILSDYCRQLTTIKQEAIDDSEFFPSVLARLLVFIEKPDEVCLASWGNYDRKQLIQDCQRHTKPYTFGENHLNIKELFAQTFQVRMCGMKRALSILGLQIEGTHHRGLDDARNICQILRHIMLKQTT
jgi:inhibitor of KinA sporulation pathway (predicted exonuclease)